MMMMMTMMMMMLLLHRLHRSIVHSERMGKNKEWLCDSPQAGGEAHRRERTSGGGRGEGGGRGGRFPAQRCLTLQHGYNVWSIFFGGELT